MLALRQPWATLFGLVLPPLGIVLLLRSRLRWPLKLLASAPLTLLCALAVLYLLGYRIELDGTGIRPILAANRGEKQYQRIDRSRAQQRSSPPPAAQAALTSVSANAQAPAAPAPRMRPALAEDLPLTELDWPDYRGWKRSGLYPGPILTSWPQKGLRELWRQPVGGGYASVTVAANRIYTIEQRRDSEVVTAYDLHTGRELWTNSWKAFFREAMGGDGPRATPVYHQGLIYALGAEGELRCLDARTGQTLWRHDILRENGAANLPWGMAASPLIVDEKVIVLPGGPRGKSVVAYHYKTGRLIWSALDDKQSYTSPMLVDLAGRRQILVVSAQRALGLDPETGALLWSYPWRTEYDVNAAQPIIISPNQFFISAGYGHGAALVEVSDGHARTVWSNPRMKNKFNSSVLFNGYVYGLDEGILACVNASTGELKWKGGRYGYGQVLAAENRLIITSEGGDVALVEATPEAYRELARFEALQGKTWNNPAIAHGRLIVRNTTDMACYQIAP